MIVTFGVRNCKGRGILVESIDIGDGDLYYFKPQNQFLSSHCVQMQNIIKASDVKATKKIQVDTSPFSFEYFDPARKTVWFKGIKLESNTQQINKTMTKRINIDAGVKKRLFTLNDTKEAKAAEKKKKIDERNAKVEAEFQRVRAARIHALVTARRSELDMEAEDEQL